MSDENILTQEQEAVAPAMLAENYTGESVQVLKDAAHIRQRPGMYIGDTGSKGLHHLVYELVYNSVDEALAGFCKNIHVKINADGSISVADDGRGIPVDIHPDVGRPTLEVVLTTVGAGAKFDKGTYKTSAGLHGIGAKAVTALAEWCEAEVRRAGKVYVQEYERGKPVTEVKEIGATPGHRTGTKVTFKPDPTIFKNAVFDYDTLENRLRELAYLNKGLAIKLTDEISNKEEIFAYSGGVAEFVEHLNRTEETIHKVLYVDKTSDDVRVEIAFQYTTGEEERSRCYANNAHNPGGGTHLSGFRSALTRAIGAYGNKQNLFKDISPIGEDFREGITAVISVQVPDPQFESQTKIRLNNPEVERIVTSVLYEYLTTFLEENPKEASKIIKKVALAAEAREAATKAKKDLKKRKSMVDSGSLPGKLMDCISDGDETELFLVEGASAAGSADNGRDRNNQALLPLRGKVLNVEKAIEKKILDNDELCNLISAIGIDIGNTEDVSRMRYGKIILLTDADVDGQHIRTLLLTFFFRQMKKLIENGHIYVARPPLFKVEQKKQIRYVQTLSGMDGELLERGVAGARLLVTPAAATVAGKAAEPIVYEGERLTQLVSLLEEMEKKGLSILERRGLNIVNLLAQIKDGKLPLYRILLGSQENWFFTPAEIDAFRQQKQQQGRQLIVADEGTPTGNGHGELIAIQELHEIRDVNIGLEKLVAMGLKPADLVPAPRIAGREPPQRFFLESDGKKPALPHLRVLVSEVRKLGEKGIKITRFKGLGEMDGEELWETTLDPEKRTLLQVQLEDALKADEMFRILMGEKVEPRRDFIHKHALEADVDYHGA